MPRLVQLARPEGLLDLTTESTEPRFAGWYGDNAKIAAYLDELRAAHLT